MANIHWLEILDAVLVCALLWGAVAWLRRIGAGMVLGVIAASSALYLLARQLDLPLTGWLLQGVFAIAVIAMVVVFQPDLRRLVAQLGSLFRRRSGATSSATKDVLVAAVTELAKSRTGALLVLPGKEPLDPHLSGGVELDARPSVPLLLSLFDHHSPGHDGAAVVVDGKITLFSAHLPLSDDHAALGPGGTRHAAALGLAERCDALCVVVSEERGSISVAQDGKLQRLDGAEELGAELEGFAGEGRRATPPLGARVLRVVLDFGLAALITSVLWLVFAPGSAELEMTRAVQIQVDNVPDGYVVDAIEPDSATLTLAGPRSALLFDEPGSISVSVDGQAIALGRRRFRVGEDDVQHPEQVRVLRIQPERIQLRVTRGAQ